MTAKITPGYRASLTDFLAIAIETETGMPTNEARRFAAKLAGGVRKQIRNEALYVPLIDEADRMDRAAAIRRDYDGTRQSRERLQLRWDLSRAQFYRIIKGG